MITSDDIELLREYVQFRSEEAFATLVSRHINLVYSVALRHVANRHQAEEISQAVFMILAGKAGGFRQGTVLSGWLYHTARLTAANYVRSEIRRAHREQETYMQSLSDAPEADTWAQVAPWLDAAMAELNEKDRNAIVLRFFDSKSFQEVGASLGTNEDAAKMRVSRAVEKLRKLLAHKGVALSTAVLCGAVSAHSVQAAPIGLAATVSASVLQGATASAATLTLFNTTLKIMAWTKAKIATALALGALLVAGTGTVTVNQILEHRTYPWQAQGINSATLNQVPPQVRVVPTKFPQFAGWGMTGSDKILGIGQTPRTMLGLAYGVTSPYRIVSSLNLPEDKYDFIANLPQNSLQALQREVKRKFGVSASHETRQTDVLRLAVKNAQAPGLMPSLSEGGSARSGAGQFSCVNQPLSCLTSMLENYFHIPVVDNTGLQGRFNIDLAWDQRDFEHQNPDALKQALLDELGLELSRAKEPVEMLVVQQAK
jgi:uncharacterized protein (TIGR03435 family)